MSPCYQKTTDEVLQQLNTAHSGLDNSQVESLLKEFGSDILQEARQKSRLSILLGQFADIIILILAIVATCI